MNIWLPIITNLVILGILVAGIFTGSRNGWKLELARFILSIGTVVGLYFLCPIITNALLNIEIISQLVASSLLYLPIINSIVMLTLFIVIYLIVSLILGAIRRHNINKKAGIIKAKRIKVKGTDRKATRDFKRQNKKLRQEQRAQIKESKASRTIGAIIALFTAVAMAFLVIAPFKYLFVQVKIEQPELNQIECGYEYTPYGQLDKYTNIVDFVNVQPFIDAIGE